MKKALTFLALAGLLASCGGNKPEPEPQNPVPSAPTGLAVHTATGGKKQGCQGQ